jgi:glutamate-ammonia-ligase adenylyltransferase
MLQEKHHRRTTMSVLPEALSRAAEQSASAEAVDVALERLKETDRSKFDALVDGPRLSPAGEAFVAVVAASRFLARLCLADPAAVSVLVDLDRHVEADPSDPAALARSKRLELLRIAALDLLGRWSLEQVGEALSRLAEGVLRGALELTEPDEEPFCVVGMGKLGGSELNYASDVDVMFVTEDRADDDRARRFLSIARQAFRVDANLRPDGRSGPLTRPLAEYRSYWSSRASTWEFQALLKARYVAGDPGLGARFDQAAAEQVWGRRYGADELTELRNMKARSEALIAQRGLSTREIKRGPGGIRDVEFAIQLLQLVHGRNDPQIREKATLAALEKMAEAGYIAEDDATSLTGAYRFLRTVEHRLQLVEEEQTHEVPSEGPAHVLLARVLGFRDDPASTASRSFDETLHACQREVRAVHERLFFRPLLEAFSTLETSPEAQTATGLDLAAVSERLKAFGFADLERTRTAVRELAGGLTRGSRLMSQLLPLLLDWLSVTPDPDLGLVGLRNLMVHGHHRALLVTTFRESPEAARRLCTLMGTSRVLAESLQHNPELVATLNEEGPELSSLEELLEEAGLRLRQKRTEADRRGQLTRLREDQFLKIATRDLLDVDDVDTTGRALSTLADALLTASYEHVAPPLPFCIVGMGRLGGSELSYASDLDVVFVFDESAIAVGGSEAGEDAAERLYHFLNGPSPSRRVVTLDLGLRPEGGQGRVARGLGAYAQYFARWAQTWERQAMIRARVVAGDAELGARFTALAESFVWDRSLTQEDVNEIRRMKARVERERIPAREDPDFHLKLGRGSLSDVEWTVQLFQLRHRVPGTGTMEALESLVEAGFVDREDAEVLRAAYRFCERTRNRWYLVGALPGGGSPGDSLPTQAHQISRLARSLGTTPTSLREEYRRVTRRARRVVERLFYGVET